MSPTTHPVGPEDSVVVHGTERDPKRVSFSKDGTNKQEIVKERKSFTSDTAIVVEECAPDQPRPGVLHDEVPQEAAKSSSKSSKSSSSKSSSSSSSKK